MSILKKSVACWVVVLISIGSGACRKRSAVPSTPAPSETPSSSPSKPTAGEGQTSAPPPVRTLSPKDEGEIRKRYMPPGVPWVQRSPAQKELAYFGWCQVYMLGDAAAKAKVLAEIKQANLSAEELDALKKKNRDMRIPLLPL